MRVPRLAARITASPEDYTSWPPILVNSLPKSGTHLLLQIARALPRSRYYGSFVAQRPSTSMRCRSQRQINRLIDQIVPGEVVPAHLHYTAETAKALTRRNIFHLFIYRDPESVILSEVAYLSDMAPWNALHRRFIALHTWEDRVKLAIEGDGTPEFPDAVSRFRPFLAWREDPNVLCLSYERLMAPTHRRPELRRIAQAFLSRCPRCTLGVDALEDQLYRAIKPENSHTRRSEELLRDGPTMSVVNRRRLETFQNKSTQ